MRYLLLGLFAFFGSSVSAAEVVSASFYTHPQTGERVLLRYTLSFGDGQTGSTVVKGHEDGDPIVLNGKEVSAAELEKVVASGERIESARGALYYNNQFQSKPIGRPVAPPPVYYLPNCPNGRCPLK